MSQTTPKPAKADEEILEMSLERPSVFETLVGRYQNAFLRAAKKIVNQREEAEDIVQESFTKIYLNAPKFRKVEGASFKSWAYKIVINTALTHYKKAKRAMESVEYVDASFYDSFADDRINDFEIEMDRQMLVSKILPQMPKHLHGVLKKYYLEDKSQKTIADEERVSVATIKMRLFRAKKIFKNLCPANY